MNYKEMKQTDIKILKEKLWELNGKKCPVLGKEIPLEKMALDHAHKRKDEAYAPDKGVIREALDWRANATLGKLENSLKRTGLVYDEGFNLPTFLRNAADYFEKGAYVDDEGYMYIHPKEVKKEPIVSKRNYNKCKKLYDSKEFIPLRKNQTKKPFPEYPKNGKLSRPLKLIFEEFKVDPYS